MSDKQIYLSGFVYISSSCYYLYVCKNIITHIINLSMLIANSLTSTYIFNFEEFRLYKINEESKNKVYVRALS